MKIVDFGRKYAILRLISYLKIDDFGRTYAILRLISYSKIDDFGWKYANLRLISYLKINDFGRNYAILRLISFLKIDDNMVLYYQYIIKIDGIHACRREAFASLSKRGPLNTLRVALERVVYQISLIEVFSFFSE